MRRNVRRLSREVSDPLSSKPSAAAGNQSFLESLLKSNALNEFSHKTASNNGGGGDGGDDSNDDSDDDLDNEEEQEEDDDDEYVDGANGFPRGGGFGYGARKGSRGKAKCRGGGAVLPGGGRRGSGGGAGSLVDSREIKGAYYAAASLKRRTTKSKAKAARKATGLEGEKKNDQFFTRVEIVSTCLSRYYVEQPRGLEGKSAIFGHRSLATCRTNMARTRLPRNKERVSVRGGDCNRLQRRTKR